ncbi:ribonucleoside-diphosphate reductase [Flammeovirgaceae bacterium 311]|nr:ribonucleoside-diphosphate reductase [Flammeovirgaceae bacterium 311]
MNKPTAPNKKGISIKRHFTRNKHNPYEHFTFSKRSSTIRNPTGDAVFEMQDVEVPEAWSQIATDILAQKYFRKAGVPQAGASLGGESSAKQVVHRLAACWQHWGEQGGYFATADDARAFYDELVFMLLGQYAAPNSPQWFNTGLHNSYGIDSVAEGHYYVDPRTGELQESTSGYQRPQPHACFILSVKDKLVGDGGIMDLLMREARVFKYGSGAGTNYSDIRSVNEKLSGGGYSSGLMSFLKVGDRAAGAIKSGGTTRRAAKMVVVDLDHPEIEEFISWKVEEEKKVAALIAAGYSSDYEGEAYRTVSGQNSNNSVRIPNEFFSALEQNTSWKLTARADGKLMKEVPARKLWDQLNSAAWQCADPGVQFSSTINEWHTCPAGGSIRASNPCSEYLFLDNTACNLASLNLRKFYDGETGIFDVEAFRHASRLWTIVLEISVLMAQFPSPEVAQRSFNYRTIGLGYANLGALLMVAGLPYDSPEARGMAGAITAILTASAYSTSAEMAAVLGAFSKYQENKSSMLQVIRHHRAAAWGHHEVLQELQVRPQVLEATHCPEYLLTAARQAWDSALEGGEQWGYRNAQATALAPTGTIGLLMDCDTTGVEPDFALVKFKKLSGGGYFKIINGAIPAALKKLGYTPLENEGIIRYVLGSGSLVGAPYLNKAFLIGKGLEDNEINKVETALAGAFDIRYVFTPYQLGEACLLRIGIPKTAFEAPGFDLLKYWGLSDQQIREANTYIAGTGTVEGAPFLKPQHLPVFDCANPCGIGKRYIKASGHLLMMAAVQPFISGAISKTINLPHDTTVAAVADCFMQAWQLGLKACTIYRDGSKLSQPLSQKKEEKEEEENEQALPVEAPAADSPRMLTEEEVLEAAQAIISQSVDTRFKRALSEIVQRKRLPDKRKGFTQKAKVDGHTLYIRTGEYTDGTLGEIFIDMYKEGASFRSLLNCFAISVSLGLQYGVPLEEYVNRFTFTRFEPAGMVDHPNIKNATSIFDFIFRLLAFEYLNRTDLVHVQTQLPPEEQPQPRADKPRLFTPLPAARAETVVHSGQTKTESMYEQTQQVLASFMGDAPACPGCGHLTIRSGTCYKCLNCGNSLGCS